MPRYPRDVPSLSSTPTFRGHRTSVPWIVREPTLRRRACGATVARVVFLGSDLPLRRRRNHLGTTRATVESHLSQVRSCAASTALRCRTFSLRSKDFNAPPASRSLSKKPHSNAPFTWCILIGRESFRILDAYDRIFRCWQAVYRTKGGFSCSTRRGTLLVRIPSKPRTSSTSSPSARATSVGKIDRKFVIGSGLLPRADPNLTCGKTSNLNP